MINGDIGCLLPIGGFIGKTKTCSIDKQDMKTVQTMHTAKSVNRITANQTII